MDIEKKYNLKIQNKKQQIEYKYSKIFDTSKLKIQIKKDKELTRSIRKIDKWFENEKRNARLKAKWKPTKKLSKTNWLKKYDEQYALSVVLKEAYKSWDSLYNSCISCWKKLCVWTLEWVFKRNWWCQNWHHFSRKMHKSLYFDQRNTRPQCAHCNAPRWHAWNFSWYRQALINKFWVERYETLELDSKKLCGMPNKYSDHRKILYDDLLKENSQTINLLYS